jgi:hypothetical protein
MARQATGPPLVRDDTGKSKADAASAEAPAAAKQARQEQPVVDSANEKTVELDSAP